MDGLLLRLQIGWAVVVAVLRGIAHRIRNGATVASWSWSVELQMIAFKAFIQASRAHADPRARAKIEAGIDPALPRRLRGVMRYQRSTVAGIPGEYHQPVDAGLGSDVRATVLYLHGGAYLAGSAATHRRWVSNLSWAIGAEAYVPNYRLAPDHRFPAALDDAMAVYVALLEQGIDPKRLFVSGDSAGGGLSAALLLRIRDEQIRLPAGAILFSPYTDLEHTAASIFENSGTDYLPIEDEIVPNLAYLGEHNPKDPYASPMYGDFTGIPPLLVFAGGREMIRDDSTRLVEAALRDGCSAELHVAPDMYHVWTALLPTHPETLRALSLTRDFVVRSGPGQLRTAPSPSTSS